LSLTPKHILLMDGIHRSILAAFRKAHYHFIHVVHQTLNKSKMIHHMRHVLYRMQPRSDCELLSICRMHLNIKNNYN